ncbi:MAG: hypothetical protein RLZZ241_1186 [Bacteroidota bacterium]|jgi:hypothetical protein
MNPSASGWVNKFGFLSQKHINSNASFLELHQQLRVLGFTYGMNTAIPEFIRPTHALTQDEKAKINLLFGLKSTFEISYPSGVYSEFLDSLLRFYNQLGIGHLNFLQKMLSGGKNSDQLEKLIDSRVYPESNLLSKIFNPALTNSLLFIDVLTYRQFLLGEKANRNVAGELEYLVLNITYQALDSKPNTPTDLRLRELFKSSLTFLEDKAFREDRNYRSLLATYNNSDAARYFLDVACLTVWEDHRLDVQESRFVLDLGADLNQSTQEVLYAMQNVAEFFAKNTGHIDALHKNNSFDTMTKLVQKLIKRNSKRLKRELLQSRELVYLLSKSTVKDLNDKERTKVREQLIDIFKSIPSLAIFMLPGGTVLLPIFIKLIPKLLPSSFDENRVEKE